MSECGGEKRSRVETEPDEALFNRYIPPAATAAAAAKGVGVEWVRLVALGSDDNISYSGVLLLEDIPLAEALCGTQGFLAPPLKESTGWLASLRSRLACMMMLLKSMGASEVKVSRSVELLNEESPSMSKGSIRGGA